MSKEVHVAVAVIVQQNAQQTQVLIAKRAQHQHQGGKWEFPGGKVEKNEQVDDALRREIAEECGLVVEAAEPLIKIEHDYGDKKVVLDTFIVTQYSGQARGNEGQQILWLDVSQLADYTFPEANQPIIDAINSYFA
ncbi:mutator MutT protein [Catenovulum agarivorans DS-2]|uniref:8-oxo-dGTP diphosphatase n=1 Tax=Catenovulum agarivorans DS-2 TaxID=1328313 RepID=W7QH70_9ALTE|nr:8-oxo-dGTP diphosphatase MutT [Catenovulum agarivorans]EWH11211.1 mutator MutT protein [Catenovulum agarivorans DS-2]